jgi:FxsC-like protein
VRELFPAPVPTSPEAPECDGDGGPRYVQIVLVAGTKAEFELQPETREPPPIRANRDFYGPTPLEWRPYRPAEERRAVSIATEVTAVQDLLLAGAPVPLDEGLIDRLREAGSRNRIVVLLIDTWTLRIQRHFDLLRQVDSATDINTAVLVLWDADEETSRWEPQLAKLVTQTCFHRSRRTDARVLVSPVRNAEEFRRDLGDALDAAKRRMREYATLMRPVQFGARPVF